MPLIIQTKFLKESGMIFLDTEKAFNNLEWLFVHNVEDQKLQFEYSYIDIENIMQYYINL